MRAYLAYFKQCFLAGLQYRVAALAGMATQFFWGFMYLMIYAAFYKHSQNASDFSFSNLVDYLWLQQAFLALIMNWFRDNELFSLITSGNIAYELCRPLSLYGFWYAKLLAKRLSAALLRCSPILLTACFMPEPYKLHLAPSVAQGVYFFIALSLGLLLMIVLNMFVYLITMKIMSPMGALLLYSVVADFFSGTVIPLPLMPDSMRQVLEYLPFRYTADFAFRVYSGHISGVAMYSGFLMQMAWTVALGWLGILWMQAALRKIVVQGG